uniref:Putative alkaline phosphatase-like protein n=1 Tax=Moniliophthora roreri TaxID=221103 RepID=A0A0W0G3C0_MONRR
MEVQLTGRFTEPLPRPGDESLFEDVEVPRTPSFNVKGQGAVSWLKDLEELSSTVVEYIDHVHRQRLRILQPVDDLVEAVVQRVEEAGAEVAANTYIIFTSDNGRHMFLYLLLSAVLTFPPTPDLGAAILGASVTQYDLDGAVLLPSDNEQTDTYQLTNLASNNDPTSFQFASPDYSRLASRLDALLVVLKTCVGDMCRNPWGVIFSAGEANGLIESLVAQYDTYFDSLPKFGYRLCQFGYFEEDAAGQVESPRWNEEMAYGAS